MGMVLTEEQGLLQEAAKGFVEGRAPVKKYREMRARGAGFDAALWGEMAGMGWAGVAVPEAQGGSGLGFQGLGLILEEAGRSLIPTPLVSTVAIGASALLLAGTDAQRKEHLPALLEGKRLFALASDEGAHHAPFHVETKAEKSASGVRLTGKKTFVVDAPDADVFIVSARTASAAGDKSGLTLFLVAKGTAGLTVKPLKTVDVRSAGDVTLAGVEVAASAVLGTVGQGGELLDQLLDRARIALAAEMLGGAQAAFDMTLAYLKTRTQFGQLIGSFQTLQHRAAEMYSELELTRSAIMEALSAVDEGGNSVHILASLAKTRANDTFHLIAREGVQMHGGIGMTEEHDIGLYLKRAAVAEVIYGDSKFHRDRYAALMGF